MLTGALVFAIGLIYWQTAELRRLRKVERIRRVVLG